MGHTMGQLFAHSKPQNPLDEVYLSLNLTFSLSNSIVIALFMSAIVAMILMRALHYDIAQYNQAETKVRVACSPNHSLAFFCVDVGRGCWRAWLETCSRWRVPPTCSLNAVFGVCWQWGANLYDARGDVNLCRPGLPLSVESWIVDDGRDRILRVFRLCCWIRLSSPLQDVWWRGLEALRADERVLGARGHFHLIFDVELFPHRGSKFFRRPVRHHDCSDRHVVFGVGAVVLCWCLPWVQIRAHR